MSRGSEEPNPCVPRNTAPYSLIWILWKLHGKSLSCIRRKGFFIHEGATGLSHLESHLWSSPRDMGNLSLGPPCRFLHTPKGGCKANLSLLDLEV
jgi:hypothetical protein